ncbi:unnamed protein product [Closterium sp. NIES-53]
MTTSYLLPRIPSQLPFHQVAAAQHWTEWEMATSYLLPAAPHCPVALSSPIILAMTPHHQVAAARHWTEWEMATSYLLPAAPPCPIALSSPIILAMTPHHQVAAARHWTEWEMATSYLLPNEDSLKRGEDDKFALASHLLLSAFARIESHYFVNKGFLPADSFLLDSVPKFRHIPAVIVQGRYDVVCPIVSAWELHKAWPEAEFKIVPDAGHSANEKGISEQLVAAMESFKLKLSR